MLDLMNAHVAQEGKAARVLAQFHASGYNERDPLVKFEMAQIRHALKLEKEVSKGTSFKSLFSTPGNRKRMRIIIGIAVFSQWRYEVSLLKARRTNHDVIHVF